MAQKNKTQGFIAALLLILLIGLLFAINWDKISSNIKETNFLEIVFSKDKGTTSQQLEKPTPITEPSTETVAPQEKNTIVELEPIEEQTQAEDITTVSPAKTEPEKPVQEIKKEPEITQVKEEKPVAVKKQQASLFFIQIDANGAIVRKESTRSLAASNSPLTNALQALLQGTTQDEEKAGLRSLIPEKSKLLSVTVQNGTAVLNFSEEFEFNSFGSDGYRGQLMQVVYTATAFSTVENVQILIEGTHKQFLGSEGIWIGAPLNRNNFIW